MDIYNPFRELCSLPVDILQLKVKALTSDRLRVYPENLAFQLFIILKQFTHEICSFLEK